MARTGAFPVRPHMIAVNPAQTHVIVSFVATGHVLFIEAESREAVECLRTSPGVGGVRQAHMATPSPDGTYVTVANQNGKLFERILTDYEQNDFRLDPGAMIDSANCLTPGGLPCQSATSVPTMRRSVLSPIPASQFTFVTLRGGGLFVVDSHATPMQIVGESDRRSSTGTAASVRSRSARCTSIPAVARPPTSIRRISTCFRWRGYRRPPTPRTHRCRRWCSTRAIRIMRMRTGRHPPGQDRFLWIADRGRNFLWVVDTRIDKVVNRIQLVNELSVDPTPDLLSVSPDGSHVYMRCAAPCR